MDNAENSENSWPEEFSELKSIEESLTCGICYEYMQTVVMTPCSHNYCSLCIRRYLNFKNECPACFNQVFDTDLRVNRTLENIKQNYLKVRDKLKLCMKGLMIRPALERSVATESSTSVKSRVNQLVSTPRTGNKSPSGSRNEEISTPVRSNRVTQLVSSPQTPSRSGTKSTPEADSSMHGGNIERLMFSPSTSGIAPIFNPARNKTILKKEDNGPTVPCPVCSVNVSERHINRHLDDCLKRESNTSGPVTTELKLKPIPKLVLNLMKDSELRRRLKEHGISTVGDSKALKTRLNRFHILYNAERDKAVQRSVAEIVKQCEDEEQLEKKMLAFNKSQVSKPVKGQNENYCEANRSSFEKLIEQVKNRNVLKKKAQITEEERIDLTSPNEDLVSETATNVSNDSDSGTSSLLQRYSNDGPIKFLEVQYSGEDNLREECPENSEVDSALESNRIDDSTDAETNFSSPGKSEERFRKPEGKMDSPSTSMIEDTSNDSEIGAHSPILNKRTTMKTFDGDLDHVSISSDSNFAGFEKSESNKKKGFTVKRPRLSKLSFESDIGSCFPETLNNIQALDKLLENHGEEELKDVSLDVSDDSVDSNGSKVTENIEETLETEMNKNTEESLSGLANGDKENEPLCVEEEKIVAQRPARKRGRPSRYLDNERTPSKSNLPLQNLLHDSTTFEVALDGSLDEVEYSPEKVLKRRRGRPIANVEPQVETPQRVLRRRIVGESSKRSTHNS